MARAERARLVDAEDPADGQDRGASAPRACQTRALWLALALSATANLGALAMFCLRPSAHPQGGGPQRQLLGERSSPGLWAAFDESLSGAKYVDMTHSISPTEPVWVGFGQPSARASVAGKTMKGFIQEGEEFAYAQHGFQATAYTLTTDQLGTQLDPPAHWNELGATISDIPATVSVRPLVVIDVHGKVAGDAGYHATRADCLAWEKRHGVKIPAHSVVFFRSDWSKGWKAMTSDTMPAKFPGVALDALKFLHLERGILLHGHEPLDTDMTPNLEGEAWLMHHNFAQAEGVANLDKVAEKGCLASIGFAKILGGSGGYARYVAICPPAHLYGVSILEASGAPLPTQMSPLRRDAHGVLTPTLGAMPTLYCQNAAALGCANGTLVQ